ncbi:MAG TPA: phosphotransferase [Armatimonadota bacterium]|jgi:CheY-like chemotaxis protein
METYNVLVVDDDEDIRAKALQTHSGDNRLCVTVAKDIAEARAAINCQFFHVAFVDMQLDPSTRQTDGKTVLRELADLRPSCTRVLLTQYPDVYRKDFFDLTHPLYPIVAGSVDKLNPREDFTEVMLRMSESWCTRTVAVDGVPIIHKQLHMKVRHGAKVDVTGDEVDFIVSRLLGQGGSADGISNDDVSRITLEPLHGGRSRSVVAMGTPIAGDGTNGILCVVKLGPRSDTAEEQTRYDRYVRFLVSLNRRVELLGYVLGDTVGGVCYSFAGRSPDAIRSLGDLFSQERAEAINVLRSLFAKDRREWYLRTGKGSDLTNYFHRAYGLDARDVLENARDFAERIASDLGLRKRRDEIQFDGGRLRIPHDILGSGSMRASYPSCIVHGDMNAENVICADDDRVMCIDYRYTGWGPRTLDFAALQTSIRLAPPAVVRGLPQQLGDLRHERSVWDEGWSEDAIDDGKCNDAAVLPFWAQVSRELLLLARANFDGLTQQEHAATCLLWALRVFRVKDLSQAAKLRLLVWMSWLNDVLSR